MQAGLSQSNWAAQTFQEFVPQDFPTQILQQADPQAAAAALLGYADPYAITSNVQGLSGNHQQTTLNPYAQDNGPLVGATYYQNASAFAQPVS